MDYTKMYPTLDLHGEYSFSARYLTEEFINDNIQLRNRKMCIIHGIGEGILKNSVHEVLKNDKRVKEFKIDFMNPGCTLIELKEDLWEN